MSNSLFRNLFAVVSAAILVSCSSQPQKPKTTGAVDTGVYHNLFTEVCGIPEEEVQARIDELWDKYFTPGEKTGFDVIFENSLYYNSPDSLAYVYAIDSQDVRTEGMSYGMIICVQLDHRETFDKLWAWAKKYMAFDTPEMDGYFCWHVKPEGEKFAGEHNASDGEIYFVTALFMAANRWNEPAYEAEAQELLRKFLDKDPSTGIYPLFDLETKLPCFVPNEAVHWFSDPSYCLPAFLEIWSERSKTNAEFWAEAAVANRDFLYKTSHPETGLFPDYSLMDGTPYNWPESGYDNSRFMYDAIRCSMNIGMDAYLYGKDIERQRDMMRRYLKFFKNSEYTHGHFDHDGDNPDDGISEGAYGANAVGAFALYGSEDPEDQALLHETIEKFWNQPIPTGLWRYYNGLIYMISMLHVSGHFRVY